MDNQSLLEMWFIANIFTNNVLHLERTTFGKQEYSIELVQSVYSVLYLKNRF